MSADLPALIARVEAATGADRELDAAIWCGLRGYISYGQSGGIWGYEMPGLGISSVDVAAIPAYTASLDAAVSLVLEGWRFVGLTYVPIRRRWHCTLEAPDGGLVHGAAKTEQHARTAAALRAWQAQEGGGHG